MTFADPSARPAAPALSGGTDGPELEGPRYPVRVAAADAVAVLLGRFALGGSRIVDGTQAYVTNGATEAQTVQRWAADGRPRSQLGLCPDGGLLLGAAAATVRDIALDGDTVYTIDNTFLQARPDDAFPAFTFWPGEAVADDPTRGSLLTAVAAGGGRAAVLDVGAGRVTIVDRVGRREADWPLGGAGRIARPVDIAMSEDRVALADVATGRVFVTDMAGAPIADWPLLDGPRAVAAAPDGAWIVLGRGGWGHRYAADGQLEASWPMPDRAAQPRDVAVDRAGRVYVSFVKLGPKRERGWIATEAVQAAGVWVFERAAAPPHPAPPPGACRVGRDKTAAPRRIPLGETVGVTLTVAGVCPDRVAPVDVMILFDTSRSMTDLAVFDNAQSAVLAFLDALDAATARAGLIAFADGPTLAAPLGADIGAVAERVAALRPGGDTRLAGALDAARLALRQVPPRLPGTRRAVLIVTDAVLKDDVLPEAAAAALAADGVTIDALVFPTLDFTPAARDAIVRLAAPPGRTPAGTVLVAPESHDAERLARTIGLSESPTAALEALTVVDRVPANMRYELDSARPPARLRRRGARAHVAGPVRRRRRADHADVPPAAAPDRRLADERRGDRRLSRRARQRRPDRVPDPRGRGVRRPQHRLPADLRAHRLPVRAPPAGGRPGRRRLVQHASAERERQRHEAGRGARRRRGAHRPPRPRRRPRRDRPIPPRRDDARAADRRTRSADGGPRVDHDGRRHPHRPRSARSAQRAVRATAGCRRRRGAAHGRAAGRSAGQRCRDHGRASVGRRRAHPHLHDRPRRRDRRDAPARGRRRPGPLLPVTGRHPADRDLHRHPRPTAVRPGRDRSMIPTP
ncbi:MAG: VWA domain-containing protein [Anaerolineae bacterium]